MAIIDDDITQKPEVEGGGGIATATPVGWQYRAQLIRTSYPIYNLNTGKYIHIPYHNMIRSQQYGYSTANFFDPLIENAVVKHSTKSVTTSNWSNGSYTLYWYATVAQRVEDENFCGCSITVQLNDDTNNGDYKNIITKLFRQDAGFNLWLHFYDFSVRFSALDYTPSLHIEGDGYMLTTLSGSNSTCYLESYWYNPVLTIRTYYDADGVIVLAIRVDYKDAEEGGESRIENFVYAIQNSSANPTLKNIQFVQLEFRYSDYLDSPDGSTAGYFPQNNPFTDVFKITNVTLMSTAGTTRTLLPWG